MKVTINKIRVELQAVAEAHEMINSFFWGDFHRSWNEESLTYPLVCGYVASGGSLSKNLTNVPLTIVVADKVFKDYSSLNDTESDTLQVCRHIFNTLNMSPRWNALIRVNSASVEKFIDRGSDEIAGHILNMNVDIKDSYSICNLPMGDYDFESTAENGCAGVLIVNSDGTFNFTAPSGSVVDLPDTPVTVRNVSGDEVGSGDVPSVTGGVVTVPDCPVSGDGTAVLKDTDGNVLSTTNVAPETTVDIIAPDADYEIRKSNNAILYQGTIPSGGALVQNIQDSAVRVRKSDNQLIAEVDVQAESIENYNVADSTAVLKDSAGNIISTTAIKATESEDIPAPDTTLQVNGVTEGTHVAGSTIGINLSDGVNPVTPDSVTKVGDNYAVVLPACPPAVTRSTATLMKTGQTTSYVSGDDGDIQAGRDVDFFTLDAAPVHNDGSATLNTTTSRFTDTLGGQTYADDIVLDWSTWNGSTLLGYYKKSNTLSNLNLINQINNINSLIIGGFSNWKLANTIEALNIIKQGNSSGILNYTPFNMADFNFWLNMFRPTNVGFYLEPRVSGMFRILEFSSTSGQSRGIVRKNFNLSVSNILS